LFRIEVYVKKSKYISIIVLLILFPFISDNIISYIYTPPAISKEKINLFKELYPIINKHQDCIYWIITPSYSIITKRISKDKYEHIFTFKNNDFRKELLPIEKKIKELKINFIKIIGPVVMLITASKILSPESPGLLFIIDNTDPNKIDNIEISQYKPFLKIMDHCYASKKMVCWQLTRDISSIPPSIFDYSYDTTEVKDLLEKMKNKKI